MRSQFSHQSVRLKNNCNIETICCATMNIPDNKLLNSISVHLKSIEEMKNCFFKKKKKIYS